jgi:hypothetical protein
VNYGGGIDYLDNRDGSGWRKVTVGHGSPAYSSRHVSACDFVADDLQVAEKAEADDA